MRSINIGNIITHPVNYNPLTGILRVYKEIKFNVNFKNVNHQLSNEIKDNYFSPYFEPIFESALANYSSTRDDMLIDDKVTYVIVANYIFRDYLDEFIEWKTK